MKEFKFITNSKIENLRTRTNNSHDYKHCHESLCVQNYLGKLILEFWDYGEDSQLMSVRSFQEI